MSLFPVFAFGQTLGKEEKAGKHLKKCAILKKKEAEKMKAAVKAWTRELAEREEDAAVLTLSLIHI